ncbi:hypothetical protein Terro_0143 [Terriglobus roseus DSM 18391]|uniref:Uncharacterized protein n=1 Tax=Terriglobus roseus (strain DSM 18391 / NRRL B-41598 / KBS 63) TaxID=926566 RepID=I3ZB76_TERRK|nr:hypothetical protein [Terriglobus roseus]AFL86494.1 hypothetical protein Terro_0143 [Terriglobus roseus DSM 18391]
MNLFIDNNDGLGGLDYTRAILLDAPLTITRRRGAWTSCDVGLDLLGSGLPMPVTRARVLVLDAAQSVLFQGFVEGDAQAAVSAASSEGAEERPRMHALESKWLTEAAPEEALQPVTAVQSSVDLRDVLLKSVATLATQDLAMDVMLTGETEAGAYVTELFRGDGTTASFSLLHAPFREAGSGAILREQFDDSALNAALWTRTDTGGYLSLGGGGLRMSGGSGYDGATVLAFAKPVEMGGTLVAEAQGVMLGTGSDGLLMGFYETSVGHAHCVAGVRVQGAAGAHALVAVVNGVEQPTTYSFSEGHSYALRVRLHCAEMQRVRARYEVLVDGVLQQFGGGTVDAAMQVVIEVADPGLASSTLPTVLYDGAMAVSPAQCVFAPVNSTSLVGSVASVGLSQTGSAWVVSTATDGSRTTRREGAVGTGADYATTSAGTLTFDPGRVPQPGELLTVRYRRPRRSVARAQDAAAVTLRSDLGLPGLPQWSGHVLRPAARSSADCLAAAQALLALATGAATGTRGSVAWHRGAGIAADVQPRDTLVVQSGGAARMLPVQSVTVVAGNCAPELLHYTATFGQSRAESMSFTVGSGLAEDVPQPIAVTVDGASLPERLRGLQVLIATGSALQVDSGVDAPLGGGFEVRRSDANFGSASTADLVLRSPVRSFSVPRAAFAERFYVRMYDGSTPARYSAVSSVVLTSLPDGS